MFIVKYMKCVSRLRVVVFDVALMLLIAELEAAAGLTDILLVIVFGERYVVMSSSYNISI